MKVPDDVTMFTNVGKCLAFGEWMGFEELKQLSGVCTGYVRLLRNINEEGESRISTWVIPCEGFDEVFTGKFQAFELSASTAWVGVFVQR